MNFDYVRLAEIVALVIAMGIVAFSAAVWCYVAWVLLMTWLCKKLFHRDPEKWRKKL